MFRPERFLRKNDLPLLVASILCLLAFSLRGASTYLLVRMIHTQLTFMALWIVAGRENGDYFPAAVRFTVVIWFAFGLYEFVSLGLGHGLGVPVWLAGRFGSGNGGVPGLTAEPSFYGSLSMVQMMYLLSENRRGNWPYILCCGAGSRRCIGPKDHEHKAA